VPLVVRGDGRVCGLLFYWIVTFGERREFRRIGGVEAKSAAGISSLGKAAFIACAPALRGFLWEICIDGIGVCDRLFGAMWRGDLSASVALNRADGCG